MQEFNGIIASGQCFSVFVFIAIPLIFLPEPDRKAKMEFEKEVLGNQSVDVKSPVCLIVFNLCLITLDFLLCVHHKRCNDCYQ